MERIWIWVGFLPVCGVALWIGLRRPLRSFLEERDALKARELFRRQRESLEFRFLGALARTEPLERIRWEDAHWHDEVIWARDRQSRRLLALIGVQFDINPFDTDEDQPEHATALFEYRAGHWHADGRHLDALQPSEAFLQHRSLEPISMPQRRG
jgi:hypothetical protein